MLDRNLLSAKLLDKSRFFWPLYSLSVIITVHNFNNIYRQMSVREYFELFSGFSNIIPSVKFEKV